MFTKRRNEMAAMFAALTASLLAAPLAARAEGEGEIIYKKLLKSTVWVVVPQSSVKDEDRIRTRVMTGTGSLIDLQKKIVLTNYHVVDTNDEVYVLFPTIVNGAAVAERGKYFEMLNKKQAIRAKVLKRDKHHDLALLQLDTIPAGAQALKLAKESAGPGQRVHSLGNPGASGSLWVYTPGIVRTTAYSRKWRAGSGDEDGPYIEVDAYVIETQSATNRGDSGGPLVNDRCELVAVTQGGVRDAQQVSIFIDVREVAALLTAVKIKPNFAGGKPEKPEEEKSKPAAEKTAKKGTPDEESQREKYAATKMKYAREFLEKKNVNDAREYCEQILQKYPKTKAAGEAKTMLEELKKK